MREVIQHSFSLFNESIKSDAARKVYNNMLNKFMKFAEVQTHDDLIADEKTIQLLLEDYVIHLKNSNLMFSAFLLESIYNIEKLSIFSKSYFHNKLYKPCNADISFLFEINYFQKKKTSLIQ